MQCMLSPGPAPLAREIDESRQDGALELTRVDGSHQDAADLEHDLSLSLSLFHDALDAVVQFNEGRMAQLVM